LTAEAKADAVALAAELIEEQSGKFEPKTMPDQYQAALHEYLRAKVEQRAPEVTIADKGTAPQVINIMDALKESMAKQGRAKVREAVRKRMGKAAPKGELVQQRASRSKSGSRRTAH
jgi:non-homologous end joining protein Ku